ncbi:hypothetical protein SAMD00023353_2801090 [Rosellinia necatrix]|uniref:Uncharacterized protein n=1 Tax=Rosellinia necatrix TaxID=77044 RepID=A0A1S8A8A6_ROSNE|nr:hypothetical protein SAMD00023353_2801090 [Rosellinia necatrix]
MLPCKWLVGHYEVQREYKGWPASHQIPMGSGPNRISWPEPTPSRLSAGLKRRKDIRPPHANDYVPPVRVEGILWWFGVNKSEEIKKKKRQETALLSMFEDKFKYRISIVSGLTNAGSRVRREHLGYVNEEGKVPISSLLSYYLSAHIVQSET